MEFLNKEKDFWANAKSRMEDVDDNEIHEYINSSASRFEQCISEIDSRNNRGRRGQISGNTQKILQEHLGGQWLWSGHDYVACFIEINRVCGGIQADQFILASITLNSDFETVNDEPTDWLDLKRRWTSFLGHLLKQHSNQLDGYKRIFDDLKKKYEEDLRYSASVEHWQNAGKKYKVQGDIYLVILFLLGIAGLFSFAILFNTWLEGDTIRVGLDTIQGVILFGTLLAIFAFLVRILSRLAFSSYHLMRDAGERELLTQFYLSLINENKIDESSRDIILQALFSRTETGLLTSDSSPTMPNFSVETIKSTMK